MKKLIQALVVVVGIFILQACPVNPEPEPFNAPYGFFPIKLVNFERVNTEYDEINSNYVPPFIWGSDAFIYSSNNKSKGENFDIIGCYVNYYWDKVTAEFEFRDTSYWDLDDFEPLLKETRTTFDELGPSIFHTGDHTLIFYSNNEKGSQDLKFIKYDRSHLSDWSYGNMSYIDSIYDVPYLSNPNFNECYLTFKLNIEQTITSDYNQVRSGTIDLFYCSDSLGNYDIYTMNFPYRDKAWSYFRVYYSHNYDYTKTKVLNLNSDSNERCPFVYGDIMIFSSDRPGGFGGYDFYYSKLNNGEWSDPINMGEPINSAYDEYRAIVMPGAGFINHLLIFSSNRPEGKGGYDLYYTGTDLFVE